MTQAQVAARFGVSQKTVGRYLGLLGVEMRPPLVRAVPFSMPTGTAGSSSTAHEGHTGD